MNRKEECEAKIGQVREVMRKRNLAGVALTAQNNVSWLTAGGELHIALASTAASGQILVTAKEALCLTENIEAGRLAEEELKDTGIRVEPSHWWEGKTLEEKVASVADPKKVGADAAPGPFADVSQDIADLRMSLMDVELQRFRALSARAEKAMWETCLALEPGLTEFEAAGLLSERVYAHGCSPMVALVAADERIGLYRHPTPKSRRVEERVMLVLCARMGGLVASLTRIVAFVRPGADLIKRHNACAAVDATLIANTRVGADYGAIFDKGCNAYAAHGYANEWRLHHQGGPAGYNTREIRVAPSTKATVRKNQPVAWNPSITGTKSEDTIVALDSGPEVLTFSLPWPAVEVQAEGCVWKRADFFTP